jgi:hypothetical protein
MACSQIVDDPARPCEHHMYGLLAADPPLGSSNTFTQPRRTTFHIVGVRGDDVNETFIQQSF